MKIVAVDSACSELDDKFLPTNIISMAGIVVDYPYDKPLHVYSKCKDYSKDDPKLIVEELEFCFDILSNQVADCVHLDMSLGGINILDLNVWDVAVKLPLSMESRRIIMDVLPELKNIARTIRERYNVPVLALGKQSHAVRLAELHATAHGLAYIAGKVHETGKEISVGLPIKTIAVKEGNRIRVMSKEPMEEGLEAEASIDNHVTIQTSLNPIVRGFQVVRMLPQEEVMKCL